MTKIESVETVDADQAYLFEGEGEDPGQFFEGTEVAEAIKPAAKKKSSSKPAAKAEKVEKAEQVYVPLQSEAQGGFVIDQEDEDDSFRDLAGSAAMAFLGLPERTGNRVQFGDVDKIHKRFKPFLEQLSETGKSTEEGFWAHLKFRVYNSENLVSRRIDPAAGPRGKKMADVESLGEEGIGGIYDGDLIDGRVIGSYLSTHKMQGRCNNSHFYVTLERVRATKELLDYVA